MAKGKKGGAAVAEPEEAELDELDADEGSDEKPKGKKTDDVTFGVADLCKVAKKVTGKDYTTRDMRTLIRKMARDGSGRINREIVAGNRSRYDWSGPNDPEVKAILKALKAGELEAGKKEALAKLKENKAKKNAENGEGGKKGKGKKSKGSKAKVEEPEDDVEDIEFEDDED